jgi:hypothetical protein
LLLKQLARLDREMQFRTGAQNGEHALSTFGFL